MTGITVSKYVLPILAVVSLLGTVAVAKSVGAWQTSGRGQILLDASGQPAPEGIKGWMTLADIADTYGVPLEVLYAVIGGGDEVAPSTAVKDLEKLVPGTEVSEIRDMVAAYSQGTWSDQVIADEPEVTLGEAAVGAQESAGTDEEASSNGDSGEAEDTIAPVTTPSPEKAEADVSGAAEAENAHGRQGEGGGGRDSFLPTDGSAVAGADIKGWMSLQEVVDLCQVPWEYLSAELGVEADFDTSLPLREVAGRFKIEVGVVRDLVEHYQAAQ